MTTSGAEASVSRLQHERKCAERLSLHPTKLKQRCAVNASPPFLTAIGCILAASASAGEAAQHRRLCMRDRCIQLDSTQSRRTHVARPEPVDAQPAALSRRQRFRCREQIR